MDNKDKILLIYHKDDNDGVFSSAIIVDYLISKLNLEKDNIILYPASYNDIDIIERNKNEIEWLKSFKQLILTDISFHNNKLMKELYNYYGNDFIWIDHHLPIINDSIKNKFDNINGLRDINRSAILNAYKFLYDPYDGDYIDKKIPILYRILSAYDSWSWEKEDFTKEHVFFVNKGITNLYNLNFNNIYNLVKIIRETNNETSELIDRALYIGSILTHNDDITYENILNDSGDFEWEIENKDGSKLKAVALFLQGPSTSAIFKSVQDKVDHGIIFKHCKDNNWAVSLYNTHEGTGFHCGEFCKTKYKGGGHEGAAGFNLKQNQFIKVLKNKCI